MLEEIQMLINRNQAEYDRLRAHYIAEGLSGQALDAKISEVDVQANGVLTLRAEKVVLHELRTEQELRAKAERSQSVR